VVLLALALAAFRPVATIPGGAADGDEPANPDSEDQRFEAGRGVEPTGLGSAYEGSPISTARPPGSTQQVYEVRDSAGVRIVQYALVPERAAPIRLSAQPIFRVEATPDGQPFEIPGAAALLTDGGAVLDNREARELVFISPTGSVAVRGTEPVPDAGIFSITPIEDDTILVQWTGWREPGELALLHRGELVRTVPLHEEVANNKVIGVARDGSLLLGMPSSLAGGRPRWASAYLARYDRRAERVDTVGAYDLGGPHLPFRFPQNGAAAVSGGRFVIGRSDRSELRWFDADGTLRQILRWEKRSLVVSDSMWSVYEASYRAGISRREGEDWIQRHLEGVKQSTDEAPVFRRVLSDSQGNVWIGSRGFPLEYWTPAGYDVISEQGVWLGTVSVPSNFRVLVVGSDRVFGVEVEGERVLGVVTYRLER
jgi:hypothetical protein